MWSMFVLLVFEEGFCVVWIKVTLLLNFVLFIFVVCCFIKVLADMIRSVGLIGERYHPNACESSLAEIQLYTPVQ